jgi:hypothetical protein
MKDTFTEKELFTKFGQSARFMGGGCYMVKFMDKEIFDKDTNALFKKYKACFVERDGRYRYK